jgi:hypothetical protein
MIVRRRLDALQASVRDTIRALGRNVAQPKAAPARQAGRSSAVGIRPGLDELGGERAQRREREAGSPGSLRP